MRIVTNHVFPPILVRSMDWSAIDDDTYDYDQPVGWGSTEHEAIADLMEKLEERP